MSPVVSAQDLRLSFEALPVLCGLQLAVQQGGHTLVYGPSGSGKSTLLHVLGRLLEPDGGKVLFRGEDMSKLGHPADFRRSHVGFVFQEFHLLESLTARQNVDMVASAAGRDGQKAAALLEQLELGSRSDVPVKVLSRGERQRVALARAFANGPSLLLADEPTASLDPSLGSRTLDLLFGLCGESGTTAVVVSHDEALLKEPRFQQRLKLEGGVLHGA